MRSAIRQSRRECLTRTLRSLLTISRPILMQVMRWKEQEVVETGGCRKLRWAIRGNNKGKSGGVRTITFYTGENLPVFLLTVFGKSQKANLTKAERNSLKKISDAIVQEYSRRVLPVAVGE
ncbi:type II toxin-antitoxin system RelE/ParE family toxin [Rhizobium sp. ZK1]|uniref:type II toxin-antitoxin system RelE/ParE family toxin n=1 Tax=Rhizobium sp. ZK1 TaxID=3389872 RepID=UPI0039F666ED